jgi:hypothetical protein
MTTIEARANIVATGHRMLSEKQVAKEVVKAIHAALEDARVDCVKAIRAAVPDDSGQRWLAKVVEAVLAVQFK